MSDSRRPVSDSRGTTIDYRLSTIARKPDWLKTRLPTGETYRHVNETLSRLRLNTVCTSARCPNLGECWGNGTVTFMILGNVCTRHCRFCAVEAGNPHGRLDATEPERAAQAVLELGLRHVVITSVDRDDLPDLGAEQFVRTIGAVRALSSGCRVEVLIPDFAGRPDSLRAVVQARPDVLGHNLETVEVLSPLVRDQRAGYQQSLNTLKLVKAASPSQVTKSGIMVGLGETPDQVEATLRHLQAARVDIVTIGQYLRPSRRNLPVKEYVTPERFAQYRETAQGLGFRAAFSAPLVRSSYHAGDVAALREAAK